MAYNVTTKTIEPFKIVGLRWQGKDTSEIRGLWDNYIKKIIDQKGDVPCVVHYGGCRMSPGLPEGEFEYLAGAALVEGESVPEGFDVWDVPGGTYAVCHVPNLNEIREAFDWFYGPWLAETGNSRDTRPVDFELYPPEYRDGSEFFIYMPLKDK